MRLLAIPAVLLSVLLGCDDAGYSKSTGDTALDTGLVLDTAAPTGQVKTQSMGTQVGSEGLWDCPIEHVQAIDDPSAVLDPLGGTPISLASDRVGSWSLQITDTGTTSPVPGLLSLTDDAEYLWLDVTDGAGCTDHLAVMLSATLARGAGEAVDLVGYLAIRPDDGRIALAAEGAALSALEIDWGTASFPTNEEAMQFRIEADLSPTALSGQAAWLDCVEDDCPGADPISELSGTR